MKKGEWDSPKKWWTNKTKANKYSDRTTSIILLNKKFMKSNWIKWQNLFKGQHAIKYKMKILTLILVLLYCDVWSYVAFVPQAMRPQQADLWYRSSSDHSKSAETSPSSSLSSQHSSLAVEPAVQRGLYSLRYIIVSICTLSFYTSEIRSIQYISNKWNLINCGKMV